MNLDDGVEGELRAEVRDGVLYLDYAVRNESPRRVELAGARVLPHTSLDGGTLVVRRPLGEHPRELAPGERYAETLELPLPVPPRHPVAPQREGPPHEVAEVSLQLDYRLGDERIKTIGPAQAFVETTISAP
jgi:hypothetical protein